MSPGYAKVPKSWSHILFLTVVYVCSCKCLLNSQFFLYTTVVVLMILFLILLYYQSEKPHPLVGWITKRTWKRDCLSSVPWISEHGATVTSLKVRTEQESALFNRLCTTFYDDGHHSSQTDGCHIVSPYYLPPPPHLLSKGSNMVFF